MSSSGTSPIIEQRHIPPRLVAPLYKPVRRVVLDLGSFSVLTTRVHNRVEFPRFVQSARRPRDRLDTAVVAIPAKAAARVRRSSVLLYYVRDGTDAVVSKKTTKVNPPCRRANRVFRGTIAYTTLFPYDRAPTVVTAVMVLYRGNRERTITVCRNGSVLGTAESDDYFGKQSSTDTREKCTRLLSSPYYSHART